MMKKSKDFDCIEMKRQLQERIYQETKGMRLEELQAYIRECISNSHFADFLEKPASGTRHTQ